MGSYWQEKGIVSGSVAEEHGDYEMPGCWRTEMGSY